MITFLIIVGVFLLFSLIGWLFGKDEDNESPEHPENEHSPNEEQKKDPLLLDLDSANNDKMGIISKLQKENEYLVVELAKSKEMNMHARKLLDQYLEQTALSSSRNAELEQIKAVLEKVVQEDAVLITTTADQHFLRHNIRNFLIDKQLHLNEIRNDISLSVSGDASEEIEEIENELSCYFDVLEDLIYHPQIPLWQEIELLKKFLKAYSVPQDHYLINEENIDQSNYYYYAPALPTGITLNLLENAIRYGDKSVSDFLKIDISLQNDELVFAMTNKLANKTVVDNSEHGKGLENLKYRLRASGFKYDLKSEITEPYYNSILRIKFIDNE